MSGGWNEQGEECECGSSTRHRRIPGCTPPLPTCAPGCRHAGQEKHPAECEPTPAAMLGEADARLAEVERILHDAGKLDAQAAVGAVRIMLRREAEAREGRPSVKHVTRCEHFPEGIEAGCPRCTPSCWQCDHALGFGPGRCLTCAAKRAEDRATKPMGRTVFMAPHGDRPLSEVPTDELRAWLERSEWMLQTPETPLMQDDVRAELKRRDTSGCCYQRPGGCERHRKPRDPSPGVRK